MARQLEAGLRGFPGVRVLYPVHANAVFVEMPAHLVAGCTSVAGTSTPSREANG